MNTDEEIAALLEENRQLRDFRKLWLDVIGELELATGKHGPPDVYRLDGTGRPEMQLLAAALKTLNDRARAEGGETHFLILAEEVAEVFAETEETRLRAELLQVIATAARWIDCLDVRLRAKAAA